MIQLWHLKHNTPAPFVWNRFRECLLIWGISCWRILDFDNFCCHICSRAYVTLRRWLHLCSYREQWSSVLCSEPQGVRYAPSNQGLNASSWIITIPLWSFVSLEIYICGEKRAWKIFLFWNRTATQSVIGNTRKQGKTKNGNSVFTIERNSMLTSFVKVSHLKVTTNMSKVVDNACLWWKKLNFHFLFSLFSGIAAFWESPSEVLCD